MFFLERCFATNEFWTYNSFQCQNQNNMLDTLVPKVLGIIHIVYPSPLHSPSLYFQTFFQFFNAENCSALLVCLLFYLCFKHLRIEITLKKLSSYSVWVGKVKLKNTPSTFFSLLLSAQVSTEEKCYLLDSAYLQTVSPFHFFYFFV